MASSAEISAGSTPRVFCSETSRERGEQLAATASRIDHWILVEYRGPWRRDVIGESLLSTELKAHLRLQLAALPHSRLLFVKRPELRPRSGRRVFFGSSRPGEERFFELDVDHQDDLRTFDFAAALSDAPPEASLLRHPLFVVCTHGKRDACCARHGRPLYDALRAATAPDHVWQSTHIGGDRFAGNVVVLPHGLYYGRVSPDDVGGLLAAHRGGRIDIDHYRGRSRYSFAAQAAEHRIREETGLLGIEDLDLVSFESRGDERRVRFRLTGGAVHEVDVGVTHADEAAYLTGGSAEPRQARRCLVSASRVVSS